MRWPWSRDLHDIKTMLPSILAQLSRKDYLILASIADVQNEVTNMNAVVGSAVTLIQALADKIAANASDPAALDAVVTQMRADADNLAASVAAHPA